jgi:lactate dehydrogenase-like 2-hydroxyacid dehydrogenase
LSKPKILLACDFTDRFKHLLSERYTLVGPLSSSSPEALPPEAGEVRALVTKGGLATSRGMIDALPALGVVAFFGTGYEGIDLAAAGERKLVVTHSPGANASSVADFAMGLVLASTRNILGADRFVRAGQWRGNSLVSLPAVPGLTGTKLGIFGFGAIGRKVAVRAAGFEMEIGYHNRSRKPDIGHAYFESLTALAEWSDILVVAARADASTYHIVDGAILNALGRNGHVVNVARGSLVDSEALAAALEEGRIAGAALDVVENEPDIPARLLAAPNLILSPHIAFASHSARDAQEDMVLANLDAFFRGDLAVLNPVPQARQD